MEETHHPWPNPAPKKPPTGVWDELGYLEGETPPEAKRVFCKKRTDQGTRCSKEAAGTITSKERGLSSGSDRTKKAAKSSDKRRQEGRE